MTRSREERGVLIKTLVVCYSRTGNTALLADKISKLFGADSDRIICKESYDGWLGYWCRAFHSLNDTKVAIEDAKLSPAKYDLVIVGGPVWGSRIASPVRTYLRQQKHGLFCNSGRRLARR